MTDSERELLLAQALADLLDQKKPASASPELAGEWNALREIERVVDPAALPDRLSGHRILAEIGSGGMGRVLLAMDEALGRKVAIKTLAERFADDPQLQTRFMREARAMARLSHPNIVRIYNLGPPEEPPHFVMEYLDGAPLTRTAAALTFEQRAEMMRKVVLAADFLHTQGILHRDLKPANILAGPDLEPKLLDFGLALDLESHHRISKLGEVAGTPEYLSPEQARGEQHLDARTDIFSLGAILYELLTGAPPFRADNTAELLRRIQEKEPDLPRRRNPDIPKDLQNICLKALEKLPEHRYASAREMADDLRRYLAREAVLAEPGAYSRLIAGQVREHLQELESWRHDEIVSEAEYDGIRRRYGKLMEREDAWIMEVRRLTLPQVTLYFGAWILTIGAALLTFFKYPRMQGATVVLLAWSATLPAAGMGVRTWKRGYFRVAIAYLLAACLLTPVAVLVTLEEAHVFTAFTQGQKSLELFLRLEFPKPPTNMQVWWSLLAGLPVCWWLRRFTRAPVFSMLHAAMAALLCLATLLCRGLLDCLDRDPDRFYFHLIPCAVLFLAAGFLFERFHRPDDSRYFYPFAVVFTWAAMTGLAVFHVPWSKWINAVWPWTRGQIEYLFIFNAVLYFVLDRICDGFESSQIRMVGKSFRFVIPGHIMTSLLILSLNDSNSLRETHTLEWLLVAAACVFIFGSIARQMKNFLVSGLVFLAVGLYQLQHDLFPGEAFWPILLLVSGLALMLAAANYAPLRMELMRLWKKLRPAP